MKLIFFFISKAYKLKAQIPGSQHIKFILMLLIGQKKKKMPLFCLLKFWKTTKSHLFQSYFSISFGPSIIENGPMCFLKKISLFWKNYLTISGPKLFLFVKFLLTMMSSSYLLLFANRFHCLILCVTYMHLSSSFLLVSETYQQFTLSKTRGKN